MNKSQLVDALATRFEGNRRSAQHALESVLDTITREVARGEKVAITGFGSFEKRVRAAGWARNPATGDRIRTKKKAVPKFTAGQDLKNVISGAKKLPKLTMAAASTKKAAPAKKTTTAKSAPAKKSSTAKKTTATKAPAKKSAAKTTTAKKTATKKAPAKKTATKKAPAKKTAAKTSAAKKSTAKKTTTKKTTAKRTAKKS